MAARGLSCRRPARQWTPFIAPLSHAGGQDNGAPGERPRYAEHYYAAYVLDPDGHNVEAVCREPA